MNDMFCENGHDRIHMYVCMHLFAIDHKNLIIYIYILYIYIHIYNIYIYIIYI